MPVVWTMVITTDWLPVGTTLMTKIKLAVSAMPSSTPCAVKKHVSSMAHVCGDILNESKQDNSDVSLCEQPPSLSPANRQLMLTLPFGWLQHLCWQTPSLLDDHYTGSLSQLCGCV